MNVENSAQDQEIQQLIKQTEIMQKTLELDVQFKKNMEFFKRTTPVIYNEYSNFTPTAQKLYYSEKGYLNLLNIESQNPAFNKDPKIFANDQVTFFLKKPTIFKLAFEKSNPWNDKHIHVPYTNDVIENLSKEDLLSEPSINSPIGLLVMIGCGMGYQIEELTEKANIFNLFIYDSNKDSFYASLHIIDWESVVTKITKKGGTVKLVIGESHFNALSYMRVLTRQIGVHNTVHSFVFNHTSSYENNQFLENYRKDYHLNSISMGFFDDEQVGLAHTVANLNSQFPILNPKNKTSEKELPPVFIIGNGPSLDGLAETIRKNQKHSIIISCGTAISSLFKLGIKPDFQIESERGLTPSQWIKMGTDDSFRKNITLLALNTVSPKTAELFDKTLIAAKPNDIGNQIIKHEMKDSEYFELPFCNPTATNCGLSYAITLGFKEIYLIGTDFGMKNKDSHHSKHSIYNQIDDSRKENEKYDSTKGRDYTYSQNRYLIKGNFCDEVETTNPLDMSRRNMEIFLEKNADVVCHNPNDGAYIRGTQQTKPEDINIKEKNIDKEEVVNYLSNYYFDNYEINKIDESYVLDNYLPTLFKIRQGIILPEQCSDIDSLYSHVERIFKNIEKVKKSSPISYMTIKGSIYIMLTLILYYSSKSKDQKQFHRCYKISKILYSDFIEKMYDIIRDDPLRLDDTKIKNLPNKFIKKIENS